MTHRRRPLLRSLAFATAATLAVTACGDGADDETASDDDTEESDSDDEEDDEDDEPVDTDPPATDPPATDPPATDPPTTEAPVVTEPPQATLEELCEATRVTFVPGRALQFVAPGDSVGIEATLREVEARSNEAAASLPSDTEDFETSAELVTEVIEIFASQGFTNFELSTLPDGGDRFIELNTELSELGDIFETRLIEDCAFTEDQLNELGENFALSVATLPLAGDDAEVPDEPLNPPDEASVQITDDSDTIRVRVPAEWTDVDGAPGDGSSLLIASTDIDAFLNGFDTPGMFIETAPSVDGDAAAPVAFDTVVTNYTNGGCFVNFELTYSDQLYNGNEAIMNCVPGFTTRVIGGTDEAGSLIFIVAMVTADGDTTTRDLIANTFFVG